MKQLEQLWTPIGNKVAVKVYHIEMTKGGLYLPDSITAKSIDAMDTPKGLVYAVGPDVKQCKRGDVVMALAQQGAWKVKHLDQELILVEETDIAGILLMPTEQEVLEEHSRNPRWRKILEKTYPESGVQWRIELMTAEGLLEKE